MYLFINKRPIEAINILYCFFVAINAILQDRIAVSETKFINKNSFLCRNKEVNVYIWEPRWKHV